MADKSVPAGKVPPQNLDAEMSLLGAILIDEETLADITELQRVKFVMKGGRVIRNEMTPAAVAAR